MNYTAKQTGYLTNQLVTSITCQVSITINTNSILSDSLADENIITLMYVTVVINEIG